MNSLDLFTNPVAAFLADLVVKATVLLILATGLAAMLRKSSAAVRHRVWSLTFAGLLLLPALSYVMPELQLPILPAEMVQRPATQPVVEELPKESETIPASPALPPEQFVADQSTTLSPPIDDRGMPNELAPWELDPAMSPPLETRQVEAVEAEPETVVAESSDDEPTLTEPVPPADPPPNRSATLWLWIWIGGLSIFLLPVLVGLLQNRVLSGLSRKVADSSTLELLDSLRTRLSINRQIRLIESDHSRIPLTWGLLWPMVLFPAAWLSWSAERKRLVLLHELAHVKRWDVACQLLARIVCAVYWFHPLTWYALKRLKSESELACDDCVLMTGESPQQYASELVDIARSARRAIYPAAVAMAQTSSLEQRIRALLDRARSRLPLGGRLAALLFAVSLLTVGGIAAVKPVASKVAAETEAPVEDETLKVAVVKETTGEGSDDVVKASDEDAKAAEEEDKLSTYRGTVVGPDGKPVEGASVKYLYSFAEYPKDKAWLGREGRMSSWPPTQIGSFDETTTDENGNYELEQNWSQFQRENEQRGTTRIQSSAMIVASVDAPVAKPMTGWIRSVTNFLNPDNTSIRLQTANGEPIQGRLIDLEGRPLAGARVTVELVTHSKPGEVDRWLSDVKRLTEKGDLPVDPGETSDSQTESPETKAARFPANEAKVRGEMIGLQPVVTDNQGRFEFPNPGDDCLVMLRVESEGYATFTANVVTRAMQRVEARGALFHGLDTPYIESPHEFHGLNCTIVVPPSQPLVGVIRDADTKKPIPGLIVTADQGEAISETDAEGRYRLDGLAPGSAERMSIYTPDSSPYFPREFIKVPKEPGTTPIELNFELRAGIWIEGRVVNRKTGKGQPIVSLHYTPYLDNPHAKRYQTFNPNVQSIITNDYRFMTDSEGRFRLRAIPGRGIVLAVSKQGVFRTGLGADNIAALDESRDFASRLTYDDVSKKFCHSMAAVDIPDDAKTATLDLEVDPGGTVTLNVHDPDGKSLQGYKISGHQPSITKPNFPVSDSQVVIQGLSPKEQRPVLMLHEERKLGRVLEIDADAESGSEKTVKLQLLARVTGRLLDGNGKPVEEAAVHIWIKNSYANYAIVLAEIFTDDDGRFEFDELLPGGSYRIFCRSESNRLELIDAVEPQPGETIDFGDIDITKEKAPEPKRTPAKTAAADRKTVQPKIATVRGQVVDPAGKPVAGARVVMANHPLQRQPVVDIKSDNNGRFEFPIPDPKTLSTPQPAVEFAAVADGFGTAWYRGELNTDEELTLRLTVDEPVRGRILDLEGNPIAGVRVDVHAVGLTTNDDAGPLIQSLKERQNGVPRRAATRPQTERVGTALASTIYPPVVSDEEGRFVLKGLGRERYAELIVESPAIVSELIRVITHPDAPAMTVPKIEQRPELGKESWYGGEFTYVAEPCRPVVGTVRDEKTGRPLAGVRVAGSQSLALPNRFVETSTDEQGRFRLTGLPQKDQQRIMAIPTDGQPYPAVSIGIPKGSGLGPVAVDVDLPRGVRIAGTVRDKVTGQTVPAFLSYFFFVDDPDFARVWQSDRYPVSRFCSAKTDSSGKFSLIGFPGRGVVAAQTVDRSYMHGVGAADIDGLNRFGRFQTLPFNCTADNYNALAEVAPNETLDPIQIDLVVDPGETIDGRVVDADGKDVSGTLVRGLTPSDWWSDEPLPAASFTITGLKPGETRKLLFLNDESQLAGSLDVGLGDDQPVVARLVPFGTISGRVLDADGVPVAGAELQSILRGKEDEYVFTLPRKRMVTDREGRFHISGLIPGVNYSFGILQHIDGNNYMRRVVEDVVMKPAETKDFGTLTLGSDDESGAGTATESKNEGVVEAESENRERVTICTGQVVDEAGKPVAGADVAVIAMKVNPQRGGDYTPDGVLLAEDRTDENGRIELKLSGVSDQTHRYAHVIARKTGSAITWEELNLNASETEATLKLSPEQPLTGRLIDIEGQPAGGVKLQVRRLIKTGKDMFQQSGVGYRGVEFPAAWIPPIAADEQGHFTIHGVPEGFGVSMEVEASERFAPLGIVLNAGWPEQRGERDGTYRPLVRNFQPGQKIVLALAPAQSFEGVVTYADTAEPAPHARLTIWASQQEYGSMVSVAGQADAEGRYQITPKPGIRFGINVYPPDGTPYLTRRTPHDKVIVWKAGDRVKKVDISLPRGVLVKGRVVEKGTGKPVAKASVQYLPESVNNDNTSDEILTGWQGIQLTDEEGRFEMVVLPGPGRLLAHGPDWKYVLQETSSEELSRNSRGGRRIYANAIEKIDPPVNSEPLEITLELQPGKSVSGRVVDEQGNPIEKAKIITPLAIYPTSIGWSGSDLFQARDGRFELNCLAEGKEYPVHFLDAKHKLGATVILKAGEETPAVVLKRCGQARMRLIDKDGKPVADHSPTIEIVVTPGVSKYNSKAFRIGMLAADSDFITNVDRTNNPDLPKSDKNGELLLPVLIPGATYQIVDYNNQFFQVMETFKVKAGERLDLGDVLVERRE